VPNITQKGLTMSHEQVVKLLETGETPDGDTVGGEMAKVTANTGQLTAEDRTAIATYIKSLPPVEGPKPPEPK
jgi:mono/diheme cytochrome c family protein